jgi:hypothetical protein
MKALKDNKEYTINDEQKQRYLEEGYDVYSNDGNLLEYSPKKKIEYSKYAALEKENKSLKEENVKLKKAADPKVLEDNKALKDKLKAVEKELEESKKAGA